MEHYSDKIENHLYVYHFEIIAINVTLQVFLSCDVFLI